MKIEERCFNWPLETVISDVIVGNAWNRWSAFKTSCTNYSKLLLWIGTTIASMCSFVHKTWTPERSTSSLYVRVEHQRNINYIIEEIGSDHLKYNLNVNYGRPMWLYIHKGNTDIKWLNILYSSLCTQITSKRHKDLMWTCSEVLTVLYWHFLHFYYWPANNKMYHIFAFAI